MSATRKLSKVAQAYERCKPARDALLNVGRCMETTEDKCGIVWERWVIVREGDCVSVILYATADGWDVFAPVTTAPNVAHTITALKALASAEDSPAVTTLKRARVVLEGAIHPSCRRHGDIIEQIDAALVNS